MFARLIIGVLIIYATQAFPASNVEPENKEPPCLEKIAWYRDVTNSTKSMYDEYRAKLTEAKLPADALDKLNAEHSKFESTVAAMLQKYDTDSEELGSANNSTTKESLCGGDIDSYRKMNANLTLLATSIKSNVLTVLSHLEVSKKVKDDLDKPLSRMVNFLYLTDITKHLFNDELSLVKQSWKAVEDGIALEKEWKLTSNGEAEPPKGLVQDYDEKDLDVDKEADKKLNDEIKKLADDTDIKDAERRAAERLKNQANDNGFMSLGLGIGIASLAVLLLAVLVGSILVWLRSQSYSKFS